jgi:hypothetical protein
MSRPVVRRALRYALLVGALLIAINHGSAILRGDLTPGRLLQMALTVLVPYCVSTFSSVEALLEREAAGTPVRAAWAPRDSRSSTGDAGVEGRP